VCTLLTVCNPATQYQTVAPTPTSDRQCGTCAAACDTATHYESQACNGTTNRVCTLLTVCGSEQYETVAPTPTSDRQCGACTTCTNGVNYETSACTPTANRVCSLCGALTSPAVTPTTFTGGDTGDVAFDFTTANAWPSDGTFVVTFPGGFDLTGLSASATAVGVDGSFAAAAAGQVVTVTRSGGTGLVGGSAVTITLSVVKNPPLSGDTGTFDLSTQNNAAAPIDLGTAPGFTIP
jgi:hypothetical protein